MANDEMSQPQDHGTSDALQSFAHTIQEKAEAPLDDAGSNVLAANAGSASSMPHDSGAATTLSRVQGFLRRQPVVGVVSGIAVGFAVGRRWK